MFDFEMPEHRFRAHVIASLERIERALGVEDKALITIIKLEIKNMTTLADLAASSAALDTAMAAALTNVQSELAAANASVATLTSELATANANAADPAVIATIAANLATAQHVADKLAPAVAAAVVAAPAVTTVATATAAAVAGPAPAAPAAAPHA